MIFRYSQIDAFLRCPTAWYKQYVLGEVETKKSSALEFGTALHLGIKTILEGDDGISSFDMYWQSVKDVDMIYYRHGWDELRKLAVEVFLPNFKKLHAKKFTDIKQEQQLSMPLGLPLVSLASPIHEIQGTFDCLAMYEGELTLCDWKTSTNEYKRTRVEKNPQLYIYAALCKHTYGTLPTQIMYKTFIKSEGRIQTMKLQLSEERLEKMMLNVANIIDSMVYILGTKKLYHNHESCYCKEL
jgi:hypothetical protein